MWLFPNPGQQRAALLGLAALLSAGLGAWLPDNTRWWDVLNRAWNVLPAGGVVLVAIDDQTLRDYGRLGDWDRGRYAGALRQLRQAGASVVGLNVLLGAPGPGDAALAPEVARPGVVLAQAAPGDANPAWRARYGLSVLIPDPDERTRHFQTGYTLPDLLSETEAPTRLALPPSDPLPGQAKAGPAPAGQPLVPSLVARLAEQLGRPVSIDDALRLIRAPDPRRPAVRVISFRDLVGGNLRYADLKGRPAIIGVTAGGLPGTQLRDAGGQRTPSSALQAQALASLLAPPLTRTPTPLVALAAALLALLAFGLGRMWGFALALSALVLSVALFLGNVLFPGVTVSFGGLIGTLALSLDGWLRARRLTTTDSLTGLGNRLGFMRALEARWRQRGERHVGVLVVDLDNFRAVNETHGHATGDQLLREVASTLLAQQRRGDQWFRWGGDEFALLLDGADEQVAARVAERLRGALAHIRYGDRAVVSHVGHASSSASVYSPTELMARADRALQRQKYLERQRSV